MKEDTKPFHSSSKTKKPSQNSPSPLISPSQSILPPLSSTKTVQFSRSNSAMSKLMKKKSTTQKSSIKKQQHLSLTSYHQIISKSSFMALRKQVKQLFPLKFTKQNSDVDLTIPLINLKDDSSSDIRVMGCMQNCNNLAQLWTILPDNIKKGEFFIIHTESNLALEFNIELGKVFLAKKERKKQQFFTLQKMKSTQSIYDDFIYIKCLGTKKALSLYGVLRLSEPNDKNQTQQFYLKKVSLYQSIKFRDTFVIGDPNQKGYCISGSVENLEEVSYCVVNYGFHQRWKIEPFKNLERNMRKLSCHNIPEEREDSEKQIERQKIMKRQEQQGENNIADRDDNQNLFEKNIPQKHKKVIGNLLTKKVSLYDEDDVFEIVNYFTERALSVNDENKLYMKKSIGQREWRVKYDGFSMSIEHVAKKWYIDVEDMSLCLGGNAKLWEKMVSKEHHYIN